MRYEKERKSENLLYDTSVENLFISELLPEAPGDAVKVYLYGLMYAGLRREISNAQIAHTLRLDEPTVEASWAYWERKGAVRRVFRSPEEKTLYDIEYRRLKESLYGKRNAPEADAAFAEDTETMTAAPSGTVLTDESIHEMFIEIEEIIGEPLSDVTSINKWMEKYGATPETITEAFRFAAVSRKNTRTSYVEAIVREWTERGLLSREAIRDHLDAHDARHALYRRVLRAIGLYRNPTEEEERLMDSWFDELGFTIDRVLEACDRTAAIPNPNIKYINAVLRGWYRDEHGTEPASKEAPAGPGGLTAAFVRKRTEEYVRLREEEERDAEKRRAVIYEKFPRIREIDEETHQLTMNLTRMALGGHGLGAAAGMRSRVEKLEREKDAILTSAGLTANDLEIHYTCEKCRDTGYLEDGSRCECFVGGAN